MVPQPCVLDLTSSASIETIVSTPSTIAYAYGDVDEQEQDVRSIPSTISLASDMDDEEEPLEDPPPLSSQQTIEIEVASNEVVNEIHGTHSSLSDVAAKRYEDAPTEVLYTHHVSNPGPLAPFTVISETRIVDDTANRNTEELNLVFLLLFFFFLFFSFLFLFLLFFSF